MKKKRFGKPKKEFIHVWFDGGVHKKRLTKARNTINWDILVRNIFQKKINYKIFPV
jgi:hypothetical protein